MMLSYPIKEVSALLPHSGKMMLLDSVEYYDEHSLLAYAHIDEHHILLPTGSDALPSYLAMEIMAQGIAAWAGIQAINRGEKVRLGFLLGTRRLHWTTPDIPIGTLLSIEVKQSWQDSTGMGVFDCTLYARNHHQNANHQTDETLLLSASLNVFSPESNDALQQILQTA